MEERLILQEIRETPAAITATIEETRPSAAAAAATVRRRGAGRLYITGNGTSYYSSLAASYTARSLPASEGPFVLAMMAGDLRYFTPALSENDVLVGVSASGEFRDILALFTRLQGQVLRVGVTHVPGSSLTRESDALLISGGGPSRVPVMTKTYASTLTAVHLLLLELFAAPEAVYQDLRATASRAEEAISAAEEIVPKIAEPVSQFEHAFYFGAGNGYTAALEGALKMKEMALFHAEASESWEMASGPATMVSHKTLCVGLYTGHKDGDEATAQAARHARQWGARVLEVGPTCYAGDLHLPVMAPRYHGFASLALVPPLALLAETVARVRGINPDRPAWSERYRSQGMTHIVGG